MKMILLILILSFQALAENHDENAPGQRPVAEVEPVPQVLQRWMNQIENPQSTYQQRVQATEKIRALLMRDCGRFLPHIQAAEQDLNRTLELRRRLEGFIREQAVDWATTMNAVLGQVKAHFSTRESHETAMAVNTAIMAYNKNHTPDLERLRNAALDPKKPAARDLFLEAVHTVVESAGHRIISDPKPGFLVPVIVQKNGTSDFYEVGVWPDFAWAGKVVKAPTGEFKYFEVTTKPQLALNQLQLACLGGTDLQFQPLRIPGVAVTTSQLMGGGLSHLGQFSPRSILEVADYFQDLFPESAAEIKATARLWSNEFQIQ